MERLLFIGMWNFADDEGLIKAHPSYLKANIFPYDDNLKPESIEKALQNFESKGMVYRYSNNNQKYIWIIKFRVYQRIDKPQKPTNPLPSIQNAAFARAVFKRDNHICHICKGEVTVGSPLNVVDSSAPSLDHIIPQSKGGSHAPSNLATACISCNKRRGNNDIIPFQEDSENVLGTLTDEVNRSKEKLKEKKKEKEKTPSRTKYLDSVFLTDEEYRKCQEAMGQKSLDIGIEKLDYSITVKGGKYRDHYKTLLNWFRRGYFNADGKPNRTDADEILDRCLRGEG